MIRGMYPTFAAWHENMYDSTPGRRRRRCSDATQPQRDVSQNSGSSEWESEAPSDLLYTQESDNSGPGETPQYTYVEDESQPDIPEYYSRPMTPPPIQPVVAPLQVSPQVFPRAVAAWDPDIMLPPSPPPTNFFISTGATLGISKISRIFGGPVECQSFLEDVGKMPEVGWAGFTFPSVSRHHDLYIFIQVVYNYITHNVHILQAYQYVLVAQKTNYVGKQLDKPNLNTQNVC